MNRYPSGRWTLDHADQSAVLAVRPLAGLIAHHEAAGRYVILAPRADNPNVFDCIAENLTQHHANAICDAVNKGAK